MTFLFPQGALVLSLLTLVVTPAAAQILGPPQSMRGLFGEGSPTNPQTIAAAIDFGGGYEENTLPPTASSDGFGPIRSGYSTNVAGTMRYQRGRLARYFIGAVTGSLNHQQIGTQYNVNRLFQLAVLAQTATPLTRRSGLTADLRVAYEPTYVFAAFDSVNGLSDEPAFGGQNLPPSTDTALALTQQRWLATEATGRAFYNVTPRQRSDVFYTNARRRPTAGPGYETHAHSAGVTHAWNLTQTSGLDATYRFNDNPQAFQAAVTRPLRTHTIEARARTARRFSPVRELSFLAGGGLIRTTTEDLNGAAVDFTAPTVSGALQFNFAARWQLALNARRDITVLNGLTPEPFQSDSATLSLGFMMGRRLATRVAAGRSSGSSQLSEAGTFDVTSVDAQVSLGLTTQTGLVLGYTHYRHRFQDVVIASASFPNRYNRSAVTLGFTLWLPLYGTF